MNFVAPDEIRTLQGPESLRAGVNSWVPTDAQCVFECPMTVTREELNPCTVRLNIVCAPEQVTTGFDRAYKDAGKKVRVPGFRPGHAPRHLVKQSVDKEALYESAADHIVNATFKLALKEQELEPFLRPAVEISKLDEDAKECEFTAKVPLKPQVELGDYKSLKAQRTKIDVDDAEVEHQVEEMRQRKSTREAVTDRGVREGDVTVVNIRADGESGDGRTFMTIAGQTFPDLDAMLLGMNAEDMKSADLTFPDSFQEKDWAGKKHHCQVTVRSVSSVKMPELDDTFAQQYQLGNINELKSRLKEVMLTAKLEQTQQFVNEQLLDNLLSASTIHVPDPMWEQVAYQRLQDIAKEQQEKKKTIEQFAEDNGMTVDQLVEAVKTEAKLFVQRAQAIQEIFLKEEMKLNDQDLNLELTEMAVEFKISPEELFNELKRNNALQELTHRSINRRVMNFLNSHATIEEVEIAGAPEAPVARNKKPAAKKKVAAEEA